MASSVRFTAPARADLADIVDYISRDSPNAARQIYDDIRSRCETLAETPNIGVQTFSGVRRLVVGAYLVFYRLRGPDAAGDIEVLRIIHGARRIPPSLGG